MNNKILNTIKTLLVLVLVYYGKACPNQCKCSKQKMTCKIPEKRSMPKLQNAVLTTSLDLSDNNILDIQPNSIQNLLDLEELILDGNKIYFLENGAFQGVPHLKKLSIQNNNLHFIDPDVFADLPLLEELYLGGNSLKELPSLHKNKALKKFCISHNNLESLPNNAFTRNLQLSELKLSRNNLQDLPRSAFPSDLSSFTTLSLVENNFRNIPDVVKEMTKLEKLSLCHNPIKVFKAGDFTSFANLKSLSMTNIGLFEISKDVFKIDSLEKLYMGKNQIQASYLANLQLQNLKTLVLTHNNLGDLPGAAFANTPILEELDLSHCEIFKINDYSFKILNYLRKLDLHGNRLTNLPPLESQINLEELNLNENNISNVSTKQFRTLNLKNLHLSNNMLSAFPRNLSGILNGLTSLDLSYNQLEDVPSVTFENLKTLNISNNQIRNLSGTPFMNFSKLQTLNLKGNNVTELPDDAFNGLSKLKKLFLCGNELLFINFNALSRMPLLEVLTADKNKLEFLNEVTFSNNINLKKVSLSYNNLSNIPEKTFQNLTNLEELWLLYNQIKETPRVTQNVNLKTLALCGNPLKNLPDNSIIGPTGLEVFLLRDIGLTSFPDNLLPHSEKLQYLNLAGKNNLTAVPSAIKNMKSLQTLKLTGNPITSVHSSDFTGLDNLKELRMDKMKLTSIDVISFFSELPALRTLYMGENPWHCGCNIEWFALGIDGHRADIGIMDRDLMNCATPPRYKGKKLDYLGFEDFKQCVLSVITDVGVDSVTLALPQVEALSQDYNDVYQQVTYQPVGSGKKNVIMAPANQKELVVEDLTPNTRYMICVQTITTSGFLFVHNKESTGLPPEERETCHKITTASLMNMPPGKTKQKTIPVSTHLMAIYGAIGGAVFLALVGVILSTTVWCRRNTKEKKKGSEVFDSESPAVNNHNQEAIKRRNNEKNRSDAATESTMKRRNDKNGVRLISKNETGQINNACDVIVKDARTKL